MRRLLAVALAGVLVWAPAADARRHHHHRVGTGGVAPFDPAYGGGTGGIAPFAPLAGRCR